MRNTFETDEDGRLLLRCVRAYVEIDVLASFELHSEKTIEYGRAAVEKFVKLANVSRLFYLQINLTLNQYTRITRNTKRGLGTFRKCT